MWEGVADNGQTFAPQSGTLTRAVTSTNSVAVPQYNLGSVNDGPYILRLTISDGASEATIVRSVEVINSAPSAITHNAIPAPLVDTAFNVTGSFQDFVSDQWIGQLSLDDSATYPLEFNGRTFKASGVKVAWPGVYNGQTTVRDGSGASATATVRFTAGLSNTRPILDTVPAVNLLPVPFNSQTHTGNSVASLLGTAMTDGSATTGSGIAVTLVDQTNGRWEYSLSDGATWQSMVVSDASALLLGETDRVRFVPNSGYVGNATIRYRGWDRSAGTAGAIVNLTRVGSLAANSPVSELTELAAVAVRPENRAPVMNVTPTVNLATIAEDTLAPAGTNINALISGITDPDVGALRVSQSSVLTSRQSQAAGSLRSTGAQLGCYSNRQPRHPCACCLLMFRFHKCDSFRP